MKPSIIIIGAGGHGKVVYDAIVAQNKYEVKGFVDSTLPLDSIVIENVKVICAQNDMASLKGKVDCYIVAIGNNEARAAVFLSAKELFEPAIIIHPSAIIGSEVTVGLGTVILANTILNVRTQVGENTIINSAVVIDHECEIGNHVYLKLASILGNNTVIKDYYTGELGEIIRPFSQ